MSIFINGRVVGINRSLWSIPGAGPTPPPTPTPPSGETWAPITALTSLTGALNTVVWTGSNFVTGGLKNPGTTGGGAVILISADGTTWNEYTNIRDTGWGTGNSANWAVYRLVSAGSTLVASEFQFGGIAISTDGGLNWSFNNNLSNYFVSTATTDLHWTGSLYVAVSGHSTNRVAYSTDAVNWTPSTGLSSIGSGVCIASNDSLIIVGTGNGRVARSSNGGVSWAAPSAIFASTSVTAAMWSGTQFVVGSANGYTATSTDAVNWTVSSSLRDDLGWGSSGSVNQIIWDGEKYVAIGNGGRFAKSTNGSTWTYMPELSSSDWGTATGRDIVYNGSNKYVAVGSAGVSSIAAALAT